MGHAQITCYVEFRKRLIERFDKKDPNLQFKELAQLKQKGPIMEVQGMYMIGTDISERSLIILFTSGLMDLSIGWMKAIKPSTLQEAIRRLRYMVSGTIKNKLPPKGPFVMFPS